MVFVYNNLVYLVLLLVVSVVFLFFKNKFSVVGSGAIIIILLTLLQAPLLIFLVVSIIVCLIALNYVMSPNKGFTGGKTLVLLLLLIPFVSAVPPGDPGPPEISRVPWVDEVGMVTSQPSITVLGTDYLPFDSGKLQAFISIGQFPVQNASCYVSVLYPNMSYFLSNVLMEPVNLPFFVGLHTYDFTVPNVTGVYPVNAYCFYNSSAIKDDVNYFTGNITVEIGGLAELAQFDGNLFLGYKGGAECNNLYCEEKFTFLLPDGADNEFLRDFRSHFGVWTDKLNRNFTFWIYNWDTMSQDVLFSLFITTPMGSLPFSYQDELSSSHIGPNSTVITGVRVYDFDAGKMRVYYHHLDRVYNGSYAGDLRGNDELVVSSALTDISIIVNAPEEFLSGDALFSIIILVLALALLFLPAFRFLSGLLLVLWVILFNSNVYIGVGVVLLGIIIMYYGARKDKQ